MFFLSAVKPQLLSTVLSHFISFKSKYLSRYKLKSILGALSDMPAVRAFSLYAALSLTFNFLLQITAFVAFLSLDLNRQLSNRHDVFCCLKSKTPLEEDENYEGVVQKLFTNYFTPTILGSKCRKFVLILFFAWTCSSIYFIPHMDIGLEQEVAMPDDSFVLKYLQEVREHLSVGPPVYFVINSTGKPQNRHWKKVIF